MKSPKTVFMGTPEFALPCLEKLTEISEVAAVVTQPDRPKGRGKKLSPPPVKVSALEKGIPVLQPERVRAPEFLERLSGIAPELVVVVAFGQILPKALLEIPRLGCINVHASLLPRYRGAAPIERCIMDGAKVTGVTTMFMDEGLDTGDMLMKSEVAIGEETTFSELHDALSLSGANLLEKTLLVLMDGSLRREKQDDSLSCYAPMIGKETGRIDWSSPAARIHDLVRALEGRLGAFAELDGSIYKLLRTRVVKGDMARAGEIVRLTKDGFVVGTGDGLIEVLELQAPGKKRMKASDYLRGNPFPPRSRFNTRTC